MTRSTSASAERRYSFLSGIVRLWIAGPFVELRVSGSANIPATGRLLIACNHPSMLNTLIPWAILDRNPAVLVVSHAFKVPALGGLLRALGNVPVRRDVGLPWLPHRDHRLDRAASAKSAADVLRREGVVQLYPEGKIARGWWHRGNVIQDLAPGVATLARVTGSPVVPFGIRLGWRLGRRGPAAHRQDQRRPAHPCRPDSRRRAAPARGPGSATAPVRPALRGGRSSRARSSATPGAQGRSASSLIRG